MKTLTKSKYLLGIQCPRQVWIHFHQPEKIPEVDEQTQKRFDEGHEVGELAKKLFPNGIDLPTDDFLGNIQLTKGALTENKPLFEPGFLADEYLYSRGDILVPNKEGWDIIEVKSATKVKDINVEDVAFQKYVYEKCGLKIRKCFLLHLNNEYVRKGELDISELFVQEEITDKVNEIYGKVEEKIEYIKEVIDDPIIPENKIGKHCTDPYDCPFKEECWSFLPKNHVFQLYSGKSKAFELIDGKIYELKNIPDEFKLTDKQGIQKDCDKTGKVYTDKERLRHFLNTLQYPLYYLDFETFNAAIPKFDGLKPYQQVPFQFSLHIVKESGSKPEHISYLYEGNKDPREEFLLELKKVLGEEGSIVVYNQSFEITRLKELGNRYSKHKNWVETTLGRIVDLLVPFRNFSYYNPKQEGSASIKKVLPALIGKDYGDLEIKEGGDASLEFFRVTYQDVPNEERDKVRKALEEYCCMDTIAMVWILEKLEKISK